jgi:hypothetical protein
MPGRSARQLAPNEDKRIRADGSDPTGPCRHHRGPSCPLDVCGSRRLRLLHADRSPLGQRNVARALRIAQTKATDATGNPTFPVLHQLDDAGSLAPVPHGALPSLHSFRHTVASRALRAGESVDEIAFLLGHRDANVTRAVYVRELADARRRSMRRSRMATEFADVLRSSSCAGRQDESDSEMGRSNPGDMVGAP